MNRALFIDVEKLEKTIIDSNLEKRFLNLIGWDSLDSVDWDDFEFIDNNEYPLNEFQKIVDVNSKILLGEWNWNRETRMADKHISGFLKVDGKEVRYEVESFDIRDEKVLVVFPNAEYDEYKDHMPYSLDQYDLSDVVYTFEKEQNVALTQRTKEVELKKKKKKQPKKKK